MARASYIWIVTYAYPDPDVILGAFTVKHELVTWLEKQDDPTRFLILHVADGNLSTSDSWANYPHWEKKPENIRAIDLLRGG